MSALPIVKNYIAFITLPVAEEEELVQTVVRMDPPCKQRQRMPSLPQVGASREKIDVVYGFQVNHCR